MPCVINIFSYRLLSNGYPWAAEHSMMGRPNSEVTVISDEREQIESIARSRSLPHGLVRRAQIVLRHQRAGPSPWSQSPDREPVAQALAWRGACRIAQ